MSVRGLNRATALANWLAEELARDRADVVFMVRVLARETDRWLRAGLTNEEAVSLVEEPATTGDSRWDALVEGVVAHRCDQLGIPRPSWTGRTRLDIGWNPYDDATSMTTSPEWALLDTLETPAPILDKGVTFSYRNMELA